MSESRCPECRLSWTQFPPVKIDGEPRVRCVECKRTFLDTGAALRADLAAAREEIGRLRAALARIEKWTGEFPPTGEFWSVSKLPISYGAQWGSNGERDYMRSVARDALAGGAPDEG